MLWIVLLSWVAVQVPTCNFHLSHVLLQLAMQVTTCNLLEHSRHSWNVIDYSVVLNGSASYNLQLASIMFCCHSLQCKSQLATFWNIPDRARMFQYMLWPSLHHIKRGSISPKHTVHILSLKKEDFSDRLDASPPRRASSDDIDENSEDHQQLPGTSASLVRS
jgi:hypothetical protein